MAKGVGVKLDCLPNIVLFSRLAKDDGFDVLKNIEKWEVRSNHHLVKRLMGMKIGESFYWSIGFLKTHRADFCLNFDNGLISVKENVMEMQKETKSEKVKPLAISIAGLKGRVSRAF